MIVPAALRSKKVHSSLIGVESCLRKARDIVYWTGMSAWNLGLDTCNTCQTNQRKEPLIAHDDPPKRPWSHVATDLFTFDEKEWLTIVDYWSDYFVLNQLPDTLNKYCYQVPQEPVCQIHFIVIMGDSSRREKFALAWHFDHQTSSPYHPLCNGKIENESEEWSSQ